MTRLAVLGMLIAAGAASVAVRGRQEQSPRALAKTEIRHVTGNLYVITGSDPTDRSEFSGGNTGVLIAADGVTVVDTKLPGWGPTILQRIKTITDKPVTRIINTHTHDDHSGSNVAFAAAVDVIAHANTKTNMERMDAFKGGNAAFLPKRTFTDTLTLGEGKDRIDLLYFGAGHTNGDIFVLFPALRVVQTGDMFPFKEAPFIDRSNGGSGVAFSRTLASALARLREVDAVIPGHSPVATRQDLEEYQQFNAALLQAAEAAIRAGRSADEAAASIAATAEFKRYNPTRIKAAVTTIYAELKP
jgi:glyoxylase-like metal-dependent hydrolase (beta-lactamase superfamily II)